MNWKSQLSIALILLAVLTAGLMCGCSIITAQDALVIDDVAGNAKAISAKVQADANLPAYVKTWWAEDANQWTYMSDWAHGRRATPK